jgi:hypothetical protein
MRSCMRAGRWIPALAIVLSGHLLAEGTGTAAVTVNPMPPDDTGRMEAAMRVGAHLKAGIDRSRFEPGALLAELDFDDMQIIDFMRASIRFEAYEGLLRGAAGTLMSRAGNSLDQAVLTATLLNEAGFEARIVQGSLSASEADRLLRSMWSDEGPAAAARSLTSVPGSVLHVELLRLEERSDALARTLLEAMGPLDFAAIESRLLERLRSEVASYFWVEYRLGPRDPWRSLHPAFSTDVELPEPTAAGYVRSEIPNSLQHRLRVQAFIGRLQNGVCETEAVMEPWERPVAALLGKPLVYVIFNQHQLDGVGPESDLYFPIFNGEPAGRVAFNSLGLTVPVDAAGDPAAGVISTTARRGLAAAEALSSLGGGGAGEGAPGADLPTLQLGAAWLEYTLIAPGGAEVRHGRSLMRTPACRQAPAAGYVTAANRLEPADLRELTREQVLMLDPGSYPDAYVLDRLLDSLLALKPVVEASAARVGGVASIAVDRIPEYDRLADYLIGLLFFALAERQLDRGMGYRDIPSLVVFSRDLAPETTGRFSFDIVENRRRSLKPSATGPRLDSAHLAKTGAFETLLESLLFNSDPDITENAGRLTEAGFGEPAGFQLAMISPGQPAATACRTVIPDSARAALENGYSLVLPECANDDSSDFWWRIDPVTGSILGMTWDGRGGETQEYGVKLVKNTIQLSKIVRLCFSMDKIGEVVGKYMRLVHGDVSAFLREVYGDDIEAGLDQASACEKPLVRVLLGMPPA